MPADFFHIELLPARYGDCLWLEYGQNNDIHRVLIDGGPVDTYAAIDRRLQQVPMGERVFELVVLTHVDADHLEGLVRLFAEKPLPFVVRSVWFNGWRQMKKSHGLLGAVQGEFLSALLVERVPDAWSPSAPPWVVPSTGPLPRLPLPGGLAITLLSPTPKKLQAMAKAWSSAVREAGFAPGNLAAAWKQLAAKKKFLPKSGLLGAAPDLDALLKKQFLKDQAKPNGSSIAFLAEFEGKSALFLADAHPDTVAESIKRLCDERGVARLAVDAVKVAHHGSARNTSDALVKLIDSRRWLISTNGDQFKHPDKACMARILKHGKPRELWFNYRSSFTKPWLSAEAQKKHKYQAVVRPTADMSLIVRL
jgi:hypothetical protein